MHPVNRKRDQHPMTVVFCEVEYSLRYIYAVIYIPEAARRSLKEAASSVPTRSFPDRTAASRHFRQTRPPAPVPGPGFQCPYAPAAHVETGGRFPAAPAEPPDQPQNLENQFHLDVSVNCTVFCLRMPRSRPTSGPEAVKRQTSWISWDLLEITPEFRCRPGIRIKKPPPCGIRNEIVAHVPQDGNGREGEASQAYVPHSRGMGTALCGQAVSPASPSLCTPLDARAPAIRQGFAPDVSAFPVFSSRRDHGRRPPWT